MPEAAVLLFIITTLGAALYAGILQKRLSAVTKNAEDSETKSKEILLNARDEALRIRQEAEREVHSIRQSVLNEQQRLQSREEKIDKGYAELEQLREKVHGKGEALEQELTVIKQLRGEHEEKLASLTTLTKKEAEALLLERIEEELSQEIGKKIKQAEEQIREEASHRARQILVDTMKHAATDYVAEFSTSIVKVADEEIKGRIIGKEGRNIRSFERVTGVNVDLDDTPGEIRLSCFDPVRREIARVSLERLIADGRIQPAKIEELVKKTEQDIEEIMGKEGEKLCHAVGVYNLPKELMQLLGRFKYRYSYGQNMIQHTLEETKLGIKIAHELGADPNVVRLACLLHDIGKVLNSDEGTHVELGVELLKRHKLPQAVIDCVAQHHEDEPFTSVEAVIVYIADAISASRPGARHEDYGEYIKRMQELENVATNFPGVQKAYAISAGRELRVIVEPERVDDLSSFKLARDIANQVERELVYPGQVKVTVVREVRAEEFAR